ncbi:MAG: hypothetical protein ACI379_10820 [Nocardioides sp.]|uniref:hypothetical protein n=1 Tax=Nocardioides sp. TaxID=35761 RepID=UPI003EFE3E12
MVIMWLTGVLVGVVGLLVRWRTPQRSGWLRMLTMWCAPLPPLALALDTPALNDRPVLLVLTVFAGSSLVVAAFGQLAVPPGRPGSVAWWAVILVSAPASVVAYDLVDGVLEGYPAWGPVLDHAALVVLWTAMLAAPLLLGVSAPGAARPAHAHVSGG